MTRYRPDNTQKSIVAELRKRHYTVEIIGQPVDLIVRHPTWRPNFWVMAECKTANRADGTYKPRKDQADQTNYCIAHIIPMWTTLEAALEYLEKAKEIIGYD